MRLLFSLILTLLLFNSCFKEDDKVIPHIPGDEIVVSLDKSIYDYQIFVDLQPDTFEIVHMNVNDSWHLGFESSADGWHVIMNSANHMKIGRTGMDKMEDVQGFSDEMEWRYDSSDGDLDSTAIGSWFQAEDGDTVYTNEVFVLGSYNGINYSVYRKFRLLGVDEEKYLVQSSALDGSDLQDFIVYKDTSVQFVRFSFQSGEVVDQPRSNEWDLLFTQYATTLYTNDGIPTPYTVRGTLINETGVMVSVDSVLSFGNINLETMPELSFGDHRDIIGHEWKYYNDEDYVIDTSLCYVIHDLQGYFFKLKFVSYHNDNNQKGYPEFEFQEL